ncbi:TTAGGG repeat binding factor [Neofusicoccum ribis]|uniref:TTAGGG repeat binding factor n=1 Tax=Neofusicoccum ribis TaxID=45134 RepID=A0ABR3SJ82_9PEZI
MVRPLDLSSDSPAAPGPHAPAPSTTSPIAARAPKRPAQAIGTPSKRLKSQPLGPQALNGPHPTQPAQQGALSLHQPAPADQSNAFAVNYTQTATSGPESFVSPFGVGWSQMAGGYYDSSFAAPMAQQPFAPSYDPQFVTQQSPIYSEPYSPASDINPELVKNLPALEKLSSRILATLGQHSFQDTLNAVSKVDTPAGKEYASLKTHFENHFKQYSQGSPFADAKALHLDGQQHLLVVRKANLAAFVSSIFGGQEVSLNELNEQFLDIFVPTGARFLKWQGGLYLELKTQAYIRELMKGEKRQEVIDRLFPTDLAERMLSRHPEIKQLSPPELEFVKSVAQRRQYLLAEPDSLEARIMLPRKYGWNDFLKEVNGCIGKNMDSASASSRQNSQSSIYSNAGPQVISPGGYYSGMQDAVGANYDETITRAALMAHAALHGQQPTNSSEAQPNAISFYQAYPQVAQQHQPSFPTSKAPNPPSPIAVQSAPTQVLYDRARSASTVRAPPNSRKPGAANQRRPWSIEEERALMDGLDRVKGPHWSQILALYGPGGTISEILKDRNQVQLKDKARNLKLFFLKSGVEVPVYLQGVTGDLKTRAPAQAAKQEALAKQRKEEQEVKMREQRAQMDAAAVLAAGRWPGAGESFPQMGFPAPQSHQAIDPSLRTSEGSNVQEL